ncbi:hypothetical protein INR49_010009 [Caranx melampygus]|nr:hypothetical protein INR49_010009 [Caranx melampygus]
MKNCLPAVDIEVRTTVSPLRLILWTMSSCSMDSTGSPLTASRRSPSSIPAPSAGLPASTSLSTWTGTQQMREGDRFRPDDLRLTTPTVPTTSSDLHYSHRTETSLW